MTRLKPSPNPSDTPHRPYPAGSAAVPVAFCAVTGEWAAAPTRPARARPGGVDTRRRLLLSAERLFALRGIDAVSVREILDDAGHRNKNAARYYFGGRGGLITALANSRGEALNRRRMELLDELEAAGSQGDLRELCRALVQPLAEALDEPDNHFLGFLARYQLDRSRATLSLTVDPVHTESYIRTARLIRATTTLSRPAFAIRFSLAMDMCFTGLAGRQAQEDAGAARLPSRAVFVDQLLQAVGGVFAAGAGE
jgi:AcrR family transcriptional regulator